ncbi:MAG: DUF1592 domain-containing protein, partial [Planctomycetota bacterium]
IESKQRGETEPYAREVITSFATRAFRRPPEAEEIDAFVAVWRESFSERKDFSASVKDALVVVLTSPQFLFLIESSASPGAESIAPYELASKLSYFLWNEAPDRRLLDLAERDELRSTLSAELARMVADERFRQFAHEFVSQWLSLDKFDVVEVDRKRFPKLSREARAELRKEPVELFAYLVRENLPLRHFVKSDFILANEIVASYYGLGDRVESGFEFRPVRHERDDLGGLLSQAAVLAGLSDGREANPIKRGAWLARKIIAEPPEDPPPNVPELPEDGTEKLGLREKLERHRDAPGCAGCHAGIDPWGLPLEEYDAGGRFLSGKRVEAISILPDETEISGARALKDYLAGERIDQVAFSFAKHVASYACGRTLSFSELETLKREVRALRPDGYRTRDVIRFVIESRIFLEK